MAATQSSTTPSNEYSDYESVGYVSADGNTYIIGGPNNCTVSNNVLYINGVEQGALTAEQQQQLQQYKSAVEQWGNSFSNILMQVILMIQCEVKYIFLATACWVCTGDAALVYGYRGSNYPYNAYRNFNIGSISNTGCSVQVLDSVYLIFCSAYKISISPHTNSFAHLRDS
ncbi:unnamed protein product [Anisakis simplex]|uniref:Pepsin-I3 domain-containing protein n=1 Tax=Anisakis simplex TaxID=6269 RepID=A0A0M3JYN0_ANISI|nr:unnamed protein product [Anisakis simplex]